MSGHNIPIHSIALNFDFKDWKIYFTCFKYYCNTKIEKQNFELIWVMPKQNEPSLDLRKSIVDAYRAGEGFKKLSKRFNVSINVARCIVKKFKVTKILETKTGRGRKRKISKSIKRKLVWAVSKNPGVTVRTLVSDAASSGVTVSKKLITPALHINELQTYRPRKTPLLQRRHL